MGERGLSSPALDVRLLTGDCTPQVLQVGYYYTNKVMAGGTILQPQSFL